MNENFVKKGVPDSNGIHWFHRIQLPDGTYTPGMVNHGPDGGTWPTTRFGLPEDCTGLSVIDNGCWDGFFSFEVEKRGATEVIAVDVPADQGGTWAGTMGFKYAHKALNSKVIHGTYNIEKSPDMLGKFDLVLCYGILYHLRSPLIAVENLMKLVKPGGTILVETAITNNFSFHPVLEYRPNHEDDPTNYFYPNTYWIKKAFFQYGAKSVDVIYNDGHRATFRIKA